MKAKTSVTLSLETLRAIDEHIDGRMSRSEFVERAVIALLDRIARRQRDARDLAILNRRAQRLNRAAIDVLDYQAIRDASILK